MKLKIFLSIFCLIFITSIYSMDEKIKAEDLPLMLFMGIESNDIEQVKKALDNGVDVNIRHILTGNTALIKATIKQNRDIVELLLKYNANPDIKNREYNFTALMYAAAKDNKDITNLLLQANSDLTIKDIYDFTALDLAKDYECSSVIPILQDEPARRWSNWVKIRSEISETTPLISDLVNIAAEYLTPEEDYEEYFV